MHFAVRIPQGELDTDHAVAWLVFDVSFPSTVIEETAIACARVRALAREEDRRDVVVSDAILGGAIYAEVAVRAPLADLDRWLARTAVAIMEPLVEAGISNLVVTEHGGKAPQLRLSVPHTWNSYLAGALSAEDGVAGEFFDKGDINAGVLESLLATPDGLRGAFPPREFVAGLGRLEMITELARRGFGRWAHYFQARHTIDEARAALSTLAALPDGYHVQEDHWVVVDDRGRPRAVIDWGTPRALGRPNGFEPVRESRLANIGSRSYSPLLGHVIAEPGPPTPVDQSRRVANTVQIPLPPDRRLVMIDSSVVWSSLREGVPDDVVIMYHTALAMDIAMAEFRRRPEHESPHSVGPHFDGFLMPVDLPAEPVAPHLDELHSAAKLMASDGRLAIEQGREPRLSRSDAISAVLAMSMGVPLMTRVPEIYTNIVQYPDLICSKNGPEILDLGPERRPSVEPPVT